MTDGYEDWLRANPAPDFQRLVERRGGYANITPDEWGAFDREMAEWQERQRERALGGPSKDLPPETNPETLCICGLIGVVSRVRKGGGRPIWRCAQHRNLWPEYAVEFAPKNPSDRATLANQGIDKKSRPSGACLSALGV